MAKKRILVVFTLVVLLFACFSFSAFASTMTENELVYYSTVPLESIEFTNLVGDEGAINNVTFSSPLVTYSPLEIANNQISFEEIVNVSCTSTESDNSLSLTCFPSGTYSKNAPITIRSQFVLSNGTGGATSWKSTIANKTFEDLVFNFDGFAYDKISPIKLPIFQFTETNIVSTNRFASVNYTAIGTDGTHHNLSGEISAKFNGTNTFSFDFMLPHINELPLATYFIKDLTISVHDIGDITSVGYYSLYDTSVRDYIDHWNTALSDYQYEYAYNVGYETGFDDGANIDTDFGMFLANGVGAFLGAPIFPNITLGAMLGIIISFAIAMVVLKRLAL